jgi:hypothetical protein
MNLNKIYENLKQQAERNGHEIDEGRLRQQAWMMRDRMMFEQSYTNSISTSSAAAGAGGGGNRTFDNTINEFVENDYVENYFE